jgi:2,5-diamino-6-(ribosylamino)-4(3H)-pyrimidinone 5'-phosphate reductase
MPASKKMDRPHIHINVAATADGKIDSFERRGSVISSPRDKERVDKLRAGADAVMVGGHTLHGDDPSLTVKSPALRAERLARGLPPNPAKVALASRLEIKPVSRFLNAGPARIFLFTTPQTEAAQIQWLRSLGVDIHVLGENRVDLVVVLKILLDNGVRRLMVEGGAALNFEMMRLGFVDELTIYVAPIIFGGESAPTIAAGSGLMSSDAIPLKLVESESWEDGGVLLRYEF